MVDLDWLKLLCASVPDTARHKRLCRPLLLDRSGDPWTVATDCKAMVFVRGRLTGDVPDHADAAKLAAYFHAPPLYPERVPWAELVAWLGAPARRVECPSCRGTAATSPNVICTFCDSDGWVLPDARRGELCGKVLDRNLLACFTERLHPDLGVLDGVTDATALLLARNDDARPVLSDRLEEIGHPSAEHFRRVPEVLAWCGADGPLRLHAPGWQVVAMPMMHPKTADPALWAAMGERMDVFRV